jgi:hypothetical protein
MTINDPVVIAELTAQHELYERALLSNDVVVLDSLFWNSPHAVRYGVTENLHGGAEIQAFRQARPNINLARTISRLEIMTFGMDAGIINLEFVRPMDGIERSGRQTQMWLRLPEGWRIVSAHVSLLPGQPAYLDAVAAQIGLPVEAVNRPGVSEDLKRIGAIAQFLMEFPLAQDVEAAPVFQP